MLHVVITTTFMEETSTTLLDVPSSKALSGFLTSLSELWWSLLCIYFSWCSAKLNTEFSVCCSIEERNIQIEVTTLWCYTTHTHTRLNGPFFGTTWVSSYQKGKTNLDFTEARDSEWQWHQPGHMQVCTSLQTDNHASTAPLSFLQAQPIASNHWRHKHWRHI